MTSFITDQGTYCYRVMPFSLKNAGETYQRLVNHMFKELIGRSMEVYVDDLLVDATADHSLLSFMDANLGYDQICIYPEDEEKTSFITNQGTYCYKVMPFGLKNVGATY